MPMDAHGDDARQLTSPEDGAERLKVLVVAAAVHPRMGSEPGMGWNWVKALSRHHDLWVVCGDYKGNRQAIEEEFAKDPQLARTIHFTFLPWFWPRPNPLLRALGAALPPVYYHWYRLWHKDAREAARRLAAEIPFDLTHQLNMIGFREPGFLWELGLPHVWGPVGGTNNLPLSLSFSFGFMLAIISLGRSVINTLQFLFSRRVAAALAQTDAVVSATSQGRGDFLRHHGRDGVVIPAVGAEAGLAGQLAAPKTAAKGLKLVWSGLHINRKCLPLALRALARHKGGRWSLDVLGTGPLTEAWKQEALELGIARHIVWHGWMEREKAVSVMSHGDVLLFSSLSEGSPTVLYEALALGMPIVTLDHCGMADTVDDTCGIKVPIGSCGATIGAFSQAVGRLINDPDLLPRLSHGALARAEELRWPNLARRMSDVYLSTVNRVSAAKARPGSPLAAQRPPAKGAATGNGERGMNG